VQDGELEHIDVALDRGLATLIRRTEIETEQVAAQAISGRSPRPY
jgi:hypothetical protein